MAQNVNLLDLFQSVVGNLKDNQQSLNQADSYNQNHGDNMVEIFEVITQALKDRQDANPADQLEYAAQLLRQKSNSGSAAMYVRGLSEAASKVTGDSISMDGALDMLQTLMNGGESAQAPSSDLVGSLLGGLTGGDDDEEAGLDVNDLLGAGLAFLQSKQEGGSNLDALADAFVSNSKMGASEHRAQSGSVVARTVLQMLMGNN